MRHESTIPYVPANPSLHCGISFEEAVAAHLRRAPWLALSLAFHAALLLLLAQFPWSAMRAQERDCVLIASLMDDAIDPFEPDPPAPEPDRVVEAVPQPLIDPFVSELPDEPDDESDAAADAEGPVADVAVDVRAMQGVIGVGGGYGKPGGRYAGRGSGGGGGSASQRAVDLGLDWLARHQEAGGHWSCAGFGERCASNRCDGGGDWSHDIGVTGLALLAFLGAGHYPNGRTPHARTVRDGLRYLVGCQQTETGCFGEVGRNDAFLYDHAIASVAVTEAYGLSHWPMLKEPASRAIRFIEAARNPRAAWRYHHPPQGDNDVSVTGWMVMALKSAQDFGLPVDPAAMNGARAYLESMTDPVSGRTGYQSRGGYSARAEGAAAQWPPEQSEAMTAVAMLCRVFLGEDPERSPMLLAGARRLRQRLPVFDPAAGAVDYYYWYYGSYAMFQMGGRDWDAWQERMLDAMIKPQRRDGDERGSWDPQFDPWGNRGGRIYATAMMTLCLEVYYRYTRVVSGR